MNSGHRRCFRRRCRQPVRVRIRDVGLPVLDHAAAHAHANPRSRWVRPVRPRWRKRQTAKRLYRLCGIHAHPRLRDATSSRLGMPRRPWTGPHSGHLGARLAGGREPPRTVAVDPYVYAGRSDLAMEGGMACRSIRAGGVPDAACATHSNSDDYRRLGRTGCATDTDCRPNRAARCRCRCRHRLRHRYASTLRRTGAPWTCY